MAYTHEFLKKNDGSLNPFFTQCGKRTGSGNIRSNTLKTNAFKDLYNEEPSQCCPKCSQWLIDQGLVEKPLENAEDLTSHKSLVKRLEDETEQLKKEYIKQSKEWAKRYYDSLTKSKDYEMHSRNGKNFYTKSKTWESTYGYHDKAAYSKAYRELKILSYGVDKFVKTVGDDAEVKYHDSIEKLAYRIEKKGLDLSNIELSTTTIARNIETTITDGSGKTVRAWTILAWGDIQRPHYRYLIK